MNAPVKGHRPATYQDVLDAPPNMVAEIVRGALHLQPRPAPRHAHAHSILQVELAARSAAAAVGRAAGGSSSSRSCISATTCWCPISAAGAWSGCRRCPDTAWFELVPDWVCEVLSPGTRRIDLTDKRAIYGEAGVGHLWLVDPLARTLEAFALDGGRWVLIASLRDDAEVRVPPFEAVAFPLDALWAD